jgi:hypothetical protein
MQNQEDCDHFDLNLLIFNVTTTLIKPIVEENAQKKAETSARCGQKCDYENDGDESVVVKN